jgi:MFS family permease
VTPIMSVARPIIPTIRASAGRRPALALMVGMMGIATLMIGVTPGYSAIGVIAPILVVMARLVQGVSVGGEFSGSTSILVEVAPEGRKMLLGSLQSSTQALAVAAAALLGYGLASWMDSTALSSWGWRVPFLVGALIAPLAYYIRRSVIESPDYRKPVVPISLKQTVRGSTRQIVAGFGVVVVTTASNYTWVIYMPMLVVGNLGLPFTDSLFGMFVCGIVVSVLCPIAGALADRAGARKVFVAGVVAFSVVTWPMLAYVVKAPSLERLLVAQVCISIAASLFWGASPGLLAGMFPPAIRSTGMAICHNLGVLAFGGLAPLTLTMLVNATGNPMVPAYYLALSAVIALAALLVDRESLDDGRHGAGGGSPESIT